jgi:hypothetical protein
MGAVRVMEDGFRGRFEGFLEVQVKIRRPRVTVTSCYSMLFDMKLP